MNAKNRVFIAASLDGYIADKNGGIEWLHSIPNPDQDEMGYATFMAEIDALVMGRNTYETVLGFNMDWPYDKPVFVLSNTLKQVPKQLEDKVYIVNGSLTKVLNNIHNQGHYRLYIDGGSTIRSFLKENLIDEMIITTIPILLGDGIPLFGKVDSPIHFQCMNTKVFLDQVSQQHYVKKTLSE